MDANNALHRIAGQREVGMSSPNCNRADRMTWRNRSQRRDRAEFKKLQNHHGR
jgi:hypothetical protein